MTKKLAFPSITIEQVGDPAYSPPTRVYHPGMTLRDWFAGMAMQGHLAAADEDYGDAATYAHYAYEVADAMMIVRNLPTENPTK